MKFIFIGKLNYLVLVLIVMNINFVYNNYDGEDEGYIYFRMYNYIENIFCDKDVF